MCGKCGSLGFFNIFSGMDLNVLTIQNAVQNNDKIVNLVSKKPKHLPKVLSFYLQICCSISTPETLKELQMTEFNAELIDYRLFLEKPANLDKGQYPQEQMVFNNLVKRLEEILSICVNNSVFIDLVKMHAKVLLGFQDLIFLVKIILRISLDFSHFKADLFDILIGKSPLTLGILCQLDTSIQVDIDQALEDDHIFLMDDEESDTNSDSALVISSDYKDLISKTDFILFLVLDYISNLHLKSVQKGDISDLSDLFHDLLVSFEKTILPTHKTRFVQFVIFYYCSLCPKYYEDLLGLLVSRLLDIGNSNIDKICCVGYLGKVK